MIPKGQSQKSKKKKNIQNQIQAEKNIISQINIPNEVLGKNPVKRDNIFVKIFKWSYLLIFFGSGTLLFFLLNRPTNNSFKCSFILSKEATFCPVSEEQSVSPLCGCLNDSAIHYGLLLTGDHIRISRKSSINLTNYLITSPHFNDKELNEGFLFDANYYCVNKLDNIRNFNISEILNTSPNFYASRTFENIPFLSIVTDSDLKICQSTLNNGVFAYLPSDESKCKIEVIKDKYEYNVNKVKISEIYSTNDKYRSCPRVDIQNDSIAIIWKGSPLIYDKRGKVILATKRFPDSLDYTNVLIIKPVFTARVSSLPITQELIKSKKKEYYSQFTNASYFFFDIPIADKNMNLYEIGWDTVKPFPMFNSILKDSGNFILEVEKLLSNQAYDSIYQKYSKVEGVVKFAKFGTYYNSDIYTRYSIPDSLGKEFLQLNDELNSQEHNAHELLEIAREIYKMAPFSKIDYIKGVKNEEISPFFRYPPLYPKKSISNFCKFNYLKIIGANGSIVVGGKTYPIDVYNNVELLNLKNCNYESPSMLISLDEPVTFDLQGEGIIKIDNYIIGKKLYESELALLIIAIISILGFAYNMLPLFRMKKVE